MSTILGYLSRVITYSWGLLDYNLIPGISCKVILLWGCVVSILLGLFRLLGSD